MKHRSTYIVIVFYLVGLSRLFSQSTLEIQTNPGHIPPYNYGTGYNIDSVMGEISGCYYFHQLHVFVIDTPSVVSGGCQPWATNYNHTNPGHDFGNIMNCRARPEYYFCYAQSDTNDMQSLDSLINIWIPDGYIFGIYSWISFGFNTINTICPSLGTTLVNYWGPDAGTDHSAVIFFGIKGDTSSYDMMYMNGSSGSILMSKQICQSSAVNSIQGIEENQVSTYPNPFTNEIVLNGLTGETKIKLLNMQGQVVINQQSTSTYYSIATEQLSPGVYLLEIRNEKDMLTKKIIKK